jgi:type II secretory pathway component PulF
MATYQYQAKNRQGETKQGTINAVNEEVALTTLQSHGLTVISLSSKGKKSVINLEIEIFQGVSSREMVIFSRLLSTLLEVQVPLIESLTILAGQQHNKFFRQTLSLVVHDIQDGSLLSEAFAKHKKVFSPLYVAMVQSGEVSGSLQDALMFMANFLEEQYALNSRIKGALMYPAFVMVTFLAIGLGVVYYVLPGLIEILEGMDVTDLPVTTRMIIWLNGFVQEYILFIIMGILVFAGGGIYFLKTEYGKKFWDTWQLRLPVFGNLFKKIYIARFSINMYTLLRGGIPILTALKISSSVVGNNVYVNIINQAVKEVKEGSQMSSAFLKNKEFPEIAAQIIRVGEKTGKIDNVLKTLSNFYRNEVDGVIKDMTTLIEPAMILVLGVGVGIFVVSILMPIYNIAGSI